ncbi:long-chain-fatty-acid--CoA ligase [Microbacterium sp. RD1]|uniref:long-chain-fatty-acid--CoA ligase n=1 Tax=Microbacterium sp. RD1 TaxID=3457313 RepID=UPI003FA58CB3
MVYFTHALHRRTQSDPDAVFSICEGRETTNAETVDRVARIAGWLRAHGVSHDDRVALLDLNTDYFLQSALGIAWADAMIVPVNFRWSVPEMAYSLEETDVEVLLVGDAFVGLVDDLRAALPRLSHVVHIGSAVTPPGAVPLSEVLAAGPVPDARRQGDSPLGVFYTGGTTGVPKGVVLGHRGVLISALGMCATAGYPKGGVNLAIAPAFHMAGLCGIVVGMILDQAILLVPMFDPQEASRLIQRYRVSQALLVPTMIQMIIDHPNRADYDLSSLRSLVYGASPISEALLIRTRAALPDVQLCQAYGMTELSPTTTMLLNEDHEDETLRRSAGRPTIHALVKIVDENDAEVPRGTVGEICSKGDLVMLGYWKKPAETAEAVRDGWMHTGDSGYMDDRGYVYVVDRIKDMIISGGENVYSIEVENVVAQHPSVVQVAVIGVPDEKWGERVHAVVQLRPGAPALEIEELRQFCRPLIAGYKAPQTVEVVESWPMSAAGKILKRELRAQRSAPVSA